MSTGFPTQQGPFRALCAPGGLCARVFARTDEVSPLLRQVIDDPGDPLLEPFQSEVQDSSGLMACAESRRA